FGALKEYRGDESQDHHEVDDDDDRFHTNVLRFGNARFYTGRGASSPPTPQPRISGLHMEIRRGNAKEIRRLEAGPTDQRAIDVVDRHQLGRVVGLHRPAIKDTDPAAFLAETGH